MSKTKRNTKYASCHRNPSYRGALRQIEVLQDLEKEYQVRLGKAHRPATANDDLNISAYTQCYNP